jgi:hypothetical protein
MPPTSRSTYEPLHRTSSDFDYELQDNNSEEFKDKPLPLRRRRGIVFALLRLTRRFISRACRPLYIALFLVVFLIWQVTFNAPYIDSLAPSFEIDKRETVFIAANIIDAELISGAWGDTLAQLVQSIGVERVFVSIYGGPEKALKELDGRLEKLGLGVGGKGGRRVVSEDEEPLEIGGLPRTRLPTGEERVKRIAFLAEVRNKALEPLDEGIGRWDKVLFVNDVFFDVQGALRLLWGSKGDGNGETKAVCAADFVTSWKYYDTFATRDAEGYSIGIPIFPWFGNVGSQVSRQDVMAGKDRVRVKSCWGGMVAFQGRFFQQPASSSLSRRETTNGAGLGKPELPLRFRSEPEPFWDSSECCLIHADIIASSATSSSKKKDDSFHTGIYMNPFVRVSYDGSTQKRIWLAKRFEALFTIPQGIINRLAHMPRFNYRRAEVEGQIVRDRLWISLNSNKTADEQFMQGVEEFGGVVGRGVHVGLGERDRVGMEKRATIGEVKGKEYWANEGYYVEFNRTARRGGYCGVRQLLVMKEGKLEEGEGNWDNLLDEVPPWEM